MLTKTKVIQVKDSRARKMLREFINGQNGSKPNGKNKVMVIKKTVITIMAI